MSKITYQNRKLNGICVQCGKKDAVNGRVTCESCAEKNKAYKRENRVFLKKLGLCPRCGKNKLFGTEKECPECIAMMYEINNKSKEKRNLKSKEYYKQQIVILKKNGICRGCRRRQVEKGKTYCGICLAKKRKRAKDYRARKSNDGIARSERPNYGLCYTCGDLLDREGRVCKKCAKIMTGNLPDKGGGNEYWEAQNKLITYRL